MFSFHLIYRLIIFNVLVLVAVAWAWQRGLVAPMYETDTSGICVMITILLAVGLVSMFTRAWKVSKLMNRIKSKLHPQQRIDVDERKFFAKGEHLGDMVEAVAMLGLLGTLIGLSMVIQQLDPSVDYAVTIDGLKTGGAIAVNTSIVGAIAGLWLNTCRRMLTTAATCMVVDADA